MKKMSVKFNPEADKPTGGFVKLITLLGIDFLVISLVKIIKKPFEKEYLKCAYCSTTVAWRYKYSLIPEKRYSLDTYKNIYEFWGKWHRIIDGACPCVPPK